LVGVDTTSKNSRQRRRQLMNKNPKMLNPYAEILF